MRRTASAACAGSFASSQPFGLPVSTEQKRHARVQTEPINMIVAVPFDQHSPMFGQWDSSQTVLRRFARTVFLTASYAFPLPIRARSHGGLRSLGRVALGSCLMPFLIALKPSGVRNFSPLFGASSCRESSLFGVSAMLRILVQS